MKRTTLSFALFMIVFGTFAGGHTRIQPIAGEPSAPRQENPCDELRPGLRCVAL